MKSFNVCCQPLKSVINFLPNRNRKLLKRKNNEQKAAAEKHDKKLADERQISYPENASLTQDTGFQGYQPTAVGVRQPKKGERTGTNAN